ncbi:helix-turn-helix domain-containing protein [Candidatus Pacearchaeota archaeon]|nr:helix-turn-helix domain-containing protein [Candidatus Pacearchaeota archaeon]
MLTEREIEIIKLRKKGLKQKKIAEKLNLSQPAVSKFENNVKKKIKDSWNTIEIIRKLGVKIET